MTSRKIFPIALLALLALLLVLRAADPISRNFAQVLLSNAYAGRFSSAVSMDLLRTALSAACRAGTAVACDPQGWPEETALLQTADQLFRDQTIPLHIVDGSSRIAVSDLLPSGQPHSLAAIDAPGVLYGPGFYQARIFLMAERAACWEISVRAKHDDPPPVELEIWLDAHKAGTITYERGDQSWESLSVQTRAQPNLHRLRVWFTNDFLDTERGMDRNAYIEYIEVLRVEDARCANE